VQIIIADTIRGIKRKSQFSNSFKPNEDSTVKQKKHDRPLIGKGQNGVWLNKSKYKVEKATKTKQSASVEIPNAGIALINQTSKTHARPFWGVSKNAVDKMNKDVNSDITKYLKQVDKVLIEQGFKKV
jgi:hypothetical protein